MIDLITINCVWPPHDIQEIICYNNLYLYLYNSMYFSAIVRFNMYMYIASFWWIVLNYILHNRSVVLSQTNTLGNVHKCFFLFLQMSMNATAPPPIPATLLLRNARTQKGAFCVIVKMATGKSARRVKVNFKNQWTP